nr:RNA-directed DNA polymerase, eukaryota, reverse transcriptase zinc-binding domain protein [Tanacetum cinerariifolium]
MVKMVPYEAFACRCGVGDVVMRESYKPKTRGLGKIALDVDFLWKEERVCLLTSSFGASSTPSYSLGPSTPPSYSSGSSTPQSYSPRSSKNAECSNSKHLLDKITTSLWYDNWLFLGRLSQFISKRDVFEDGLSLNCKVTDMVENGDWKWPDMWRSKLPFLFHLPPPLIIHGKKDMVLWKSNDDLIKLDSSPNSLTDSVLYVCQRPFNRSIWSILQRLVIGALVYFVWQERNLRRFQMKSIPVKELCGIIRKNVWLRLLTLKIRSSRQAKEAASIWNLGVVDCYGGKKPDLGDDRIYREIGRTDEGVKIYKALVVEVIENGNTPPRTQTVEGVKTTIPPTTAEEKNQRRLEVK